MMSRRPTFARSAAALALLFAPLVPAIAQAATDQATSRSPDLAVVSEDPGGVRLLFELHDLDVETFTATGGEEFQTMAIPGGDLTGEVGAPAVPTFTRLIAIPDRAGVRVRTRVLAEDQISGVRLLPMQSEETEGFAYDQAAYARHDFGAEPLAAVGEPAVLRDLRVVLLTVQPVRYDPTARTLQVARRIEVEIEFLGDDARNVRTSQRRSIPTSFDHLYRALVANYTGPPAGMTVAPGTYLLIVRDRQEIIDRLQPLIEWRQRQGYAVQLATTTQTGTSTGSIKTFVQNVYDTADPPLEYVCLVGDHYGDEGGVICSIPTWFENLSGYGGEGDHPYTQLEGNDVLADVHIGRLSFNYDTTYQYEVLERIVDKIVTYETSPPIDDPGWFTRGCVSAEVGDIPSVKIANQWLKHRLIETGYTRVDTVWSNLTTGVRNALNLGDTVYGYRGYAGMVWWSNGNTNALSNGYEMPFAVIMTCDTGSFAYGTSRSEGFLRASTSLHRVAGAVGSIGTATIGTHTRYNNSIFYGTWHGLIQRQLHTMGAALASGKLELHLNYGLTQPNNVAIWSHWNNLMGCPAVDVWTAYPTALEVTHPATIAVGANSVLVTVASGAVPLADAQVCVWQDQQVHEVGRTASDGSIELPITGATAGELRLTVSGHNLLPYLVTIPIGSASMYVGYSSSVVDDDMTGTSVGNGDGLVSPGETIELAVQLENFGSATATGVTATLTSDDPYVTIVDATETFDDIPSGTRKWSHDDFDFVVGRGAPHDHLLRFGLEIDSGLDHWHSLVELAVASATFSEQGVAVYDANGRLDPGETVDLSITLRNDGEINASTVTGTLLSESPHVTVDDASGSFGSIAVGSTGSNTGDRFTVTAAAGTYQGHLASFMVITEFSGGVIDTTYATLVVGERETDDPVGPDNHGYLAFDDTDTVYPDAPTYEWIELDPAYGGSGGTEVPLTDTGETQDDVEIIDLPFTFQYYGQLYDQATVCSNGWLAMGTTYLVNYRNWTIPGAGGPDAMIAPFWDDLYQSIGSSKVLQRFDEAEHRWILEWSRFRNMIGGYTETFELILYDPAYHLTESGDGLVVFQYETVTNSDPTNGYATVGIESPDQLDGLLYTYWNQYAGGAAPLQAGRAIKFVPTSARPLGILRGSVLNASHGSAPIGGAAVELLGTGRSFTTGADGTFSGTVEPGTYTVTASRHGFEPDTLTGVAITPNEVTEVDFYLTDNAGPEITTTLHPSTDDMIGPYPIPVEITDYSDVDEATLYHRVNHGSFTPVALAHQGGDSYLGQIPGQPWNSLVEYYVYARDMTGLESFDPPGAPDQLFSFRVAQMQTVFEDDFESATDWTVGAPDDDATTGIWVRVDPNGTWQSGSPVQPEDDHTVAPGVQCFVTGQGSVGGSAGEEDVDGGKTTLFSPVFELGGYDAAELNYWFWYSNDTGSSPGEDQWLVEISNDGVTWITVEATIASTGAWVERSFDVTSMIEHTDQVQVRFVASDYGGGSLVEAAVDDFVLRGIPSTTSNTAGASASAVGFRLDPCRPNPFNPWTTISYALAADGKAMLRIFDVSGHLVRTLVHASQVAGEYEVRWDGRSQSGQPVASGVYFMRLEAAGKVQVRQTTLLR